MESSARESYFTTEVTTATPQRLQGMLIEAAVRLAERARHRRRAGQHEAACEDLVRAQEIVAQMLASLNPQADAALAKRVAGVYLFVCRSLMEANLRHDDSRLDDAIRVLQIERETWRLLCQKLDANDAVGVSEGGFSFEA